MSSKNFYSEYNNNGVINIKNCLKLKSLKKIRKKYFLLKKKINRTKILKDQPVVVFWKHLKGEKKQIITYNEFPELKNLLYNDIKDILKKIFKNKLKKIKLVETVFFEKPPSKNNVLHWHQDVAYFPIKTRKQFAIWIPFSAVNKNNGALSYALGSNKESIGPSIDLHKGASYPGDKRIFLLNKKKFFKKCFNMSLGSLLLHNGYTYHYSGANKSRKSRLALSIRFIAGDHKYMPHPFEGGAFSKQIQLKKGQIFSGKPFPIIY